MFRLILPSPDICINSMSKLTTVSASEGVVRYDNTPVKSEFGTDKDTLRVGIPVNVELSPNQRNEFTIPVCSVNQIPPPEL